MFKIFISHPKIVDAYALFNNSEVLLFLDDHKKPERGNYGDKKNICFYIFANEHKWYPDKYYKKVTFSKLLKIAKRKRFKYVAYNYEEHSCCELKKILKLQRLLKEEKNRIRFLEKYPILNKPLGKSIKTYSLKMSEYWDAVPLRDFLSRFVTLKLEYPHYYSFVTNNHYFIYDDKKNCLFYDDKCFSKVDYLEDILKEINPNDDVDVYHLVSKEYGIDLADYICDIEYVDY